jgi:hypothetical protein
VVARRQHVDAEKKQLIGDLGRDPEPARRVLAIRDNKIGMVHFPETAQLLPDHLPARLANDVTDEKDLQRTPCIQKSGASSQKNCSPISEF